MKQNINTFFLAKTFVPKSERLKVVLMFFCFFYLIFLRLYHLADIPLHDYDAVRSWQIAKEAAYGNFLSIFNHASPTYHGLNAVVFWLFKSHYFLLLWGSFCNVLAVLIFCFLVLKNLKISLYGQFLSCLMLGSSPLFVYLSRCITNENLNFLVYVLFLWTCSNFAEAEKREKNAQLAAFIFALGLTVNYKILLILPYFLFFLWQNKYPILKMARHIILSFILISFTYSCLFFLLGVPFDNFAKNFLAIFFNKTQAAHSPILQTDFFFYLKYLRDFEHIFALLFSLVAYFLMCFDAKKSKTAKVYFSLLGVLLLMLCLLPKAPRAMLYVLPFCYVLVFFALENFQKKHFFYLIYLLLIPYNGYLLHTHIYVYAQEADFGRLVIFLEKQETKEIYTANSLQIAPFLPNMHIKKLNQNTPLPQSGLLFFDNYYLALNEKKFDLLKNSTFEISGTQKLYLSPFLFYEHAEYTGLSYDKTTSLWENAKKEKGKWGVIDLKKRIKI